MINFEALYELAVQHKGSVSEVEHDLPQALSTALFNQIPDDRWLANMTMCIFQAGFVWKVIKNKWPDFEIAFSEFHPRYWAQVSPEVLEGLTKDVRIVRNAQKINTVPVNAQFILDTQKSHGNFSKWVNHFEDDNLHGLYQALKDQGGRLGGNSAMYLMRLSGKDTYLFSNHVIAALIREKVIDKNPTSKKAKAAVNAAFCIWKQQSGRSFAEISRILAMTVWD
ncbi:MAG: DNA-3-methyladenine glycosylase I [Saccharospirillaceae bacterium]|nr:DNA-3-methyladenine glycosylase I [Pseudomonadales bacterium]NRB79975.1 DNA-3-methyladenine glycosylase I [Saccharospirillaceae bacterium]